MNIPIWPEIYCCGLHKEFSKGIARPIHFVYDGVVKTLHLVRCDDFSIISTYRMYAEMIEKSHASNTKLFTYPSKIEVLKNTSFIRNKYKIKGAPGCSVFYVMHPPPD